MRLIDSRQCKAHVKRKVFRHLTACHVAILCGLQKCLVVFQSLSYLLSCGICLGDDTEYLQNLINQKRKIPAGDLHPIS